MRISGPFVEHDRTMDARSFREGLLEPFDGPRVGGVVAAEVVGRRSPPSSGDP